MREILIATMTVFLSSSPKMDLMNGWEPKFSSGIVVVKNELVYKEYYAQLLANLMNSLPNWQYYTGKKVFFGLIDEVKEIPRKKYKKEDFLTR